MCVCMQAYPSLEVIPKLPALESFFLDIFNVKLEIKQIVFPFNWCLFSIGSHTSVFPSAPQNSMKNYQFCHEESWVSYLHWGTHTSLIFSSLVKKKEKSKKAHWINKVSSSINISPPGLQNVWLWDKKQLLLLSTALTGSRRCGSSDLVLFLSKPRNVLLAQGMVPCSFSVKASPATISRHRNAIFRCTHTETYQVLGALRISFLNDFTTGISYPSLCQIKQIQWNVWVTCKLTTGTRFKGSKETHKIIQQFFSEPSLFRKKQ